MLNTKEIEKTQSNINNSLEDNDSKKIENKNKNDIKTNKNTPKIMLHEISNYNVEEKILEINPKEKATSKIDYRHYKTYPIKEIIPLQYLSNNNLDHYWLVTYDKLMKPKKILKILNDDIKSNEKPIYTENSLKVKFIKIDNFEIFFVKGFDKPFVRPKKDSFILAKLYLLSMKEINKIVNYINKTKEKFTVKEIVNLENTECENNYCELTNIKNTNFKDEDITYPYCQLYYVGKFMNISMLLVTNTFNNLESHENNNKTLIYTLPSPRKLYKLVKLLIKFFPEYSVNYFLEYLIKRNLYRNYGDKKSETLKLLSLTNASVPNKFLLNKILRETITGIQTNSSISGSSLHIDSDESSKCLNKIEIENQKRISLLKNNNNLLGFKNSLKSSNGLYLNGPIGSINYLSTNQTIRACNSIKTLQNSFKYNFIPTITIPNEINNARNEKESFGVYLTGSTNFQNRLSCYFLPRKEKGIEFKKIINNKKDKENIDINLILNKKKSDIFFGSKIENKNSINSIIVNKKKEKRNKINNSKIYHTPKKRKKIKYYK